jgi:hypothetical protein
MASRSSSSTRSPSASMAKPSERSRAELPRQGARASNAEAQRSSRGPAEKKHKSLAEVQSSGRQSDQGGRPGAGNRRSASRNSK